MKAHECLSTVLVLFHVYSQWRKKLYLLSKYPSQTTYCFNNIAKQLVRTDMRDFNFTPEHK